MSPLLLAVLQVALAAGGEINDVRRVDVEDPFTDLAITWGEGGMTKYVQGFNETEDEFAMTVLADVVKRRPARSSEAFVVQHPSCQACVMARQVGRPACTVHAEE
jgi:hypothetical protein